MILVGNERSGGMALAAHLMNTSDNEHVHVHQLRGFVSETLHGALCEAQAISRATRCQNLLFSLSLNPPEGENVPVDVFEKAISRIEEKLGLSGQPCALIFHEKNGRRHAHCVWSRIDGERLKAINLSFYQDKLFSISRELFLEHGWDLPPGYIRKEDRDPLTFTLAEQQQAKRSDKDVRDLKKVIQECWAASDSVSAFAAALSEHGLVLAKGDRRVFVAVDANGEVYSVSRWAGVKARELRNRLSHCDDLPSVEEARRIAQSLRTEIVVPGHAKLLKKYKRDLEALEAKPVEITHRHRAERDDLKQKQAIRRIAETKDRNTRLPSGLRSVWSKMTGQYDVVKAELETEYKVSQARDLNEFQTLITAQLEERRSLQQDIRQLQLKAEAPAQKFEEGPDQPLVLEDESEALFTRKQVADRPERILDIITDKQEYFSRYDVARGLADYIDDPIILSSSIERVMRSDVLVWVQNGSQAIYTTREFAKLKSSLMTQASRMSSSRHSGVSARYIDLAILHQNKLLQREVGAKLSDEQVTAIRHAVGKNQLSVVVGYAGAGKSTMLKAANVAWTTQGYRVRGAALSGKATDGLQDSSGIESRTLASLEQSWKNGNKLLEANDVLVIDEAGMIGTRQLCRLVEEASRCGAKLVLVGDPEQLQPINAGTPFRDFVDTLECALLTEVHRQNEGWQRQATRDFANKQTDKALDAYEAHGAIHQAASQNEAIAQLVQDYMVDLETRGIEASRLALAHRRKDAHAINQAIRKARKFAGDLEGEVLFKTRHGQRAFAPGDRVVFTRNDHTLGVRNGSLGIVRQAEDGSLTVEVNGSRTTREIILSPRRYNSIDHGYATTIHKSQGATVDKTFVLSSKRMDRHLTYVAMSRQRESAKIYFTRKEWLDRRLEQNQQRSRGLIRKPNRSRTLR